MSRRIRIVALALLALALAPGLAGAAGSSPAQAAEQVRAGLARAQMRMVDQPKEARELLSAARTTYDQALDESLSNVAPAAAERARDGFAAAERALDDGAAPAFAGARARVWTALLAGGYSAVDRALQDGDA
ncbi:MAG TPA: iron permease, partial [Roseiflexaceae bacterium]|nr:iron permease [Roseiflexaceae bacterium]